LIKKFVDVALVNSCKDERGIKEKAPCNLLIVFPQLQGAYNKK